MYTLPTFPSLRARIRPVRLLVSLLLVGCTQTAESEAPVDAGTPEADAAATVGSVTGSRIRTHISDPDGATDRAVDLSGATFEALVLDTSGTQVSVLAGSGTSSGQLAVPDVPLGAAYYLHLYSASENPPHVYVHTTARYVDLGEYSGQRSDVVSGSTGSALAWGNVGGLDAWTSGDQLLYFSSDNGLYLYGGTPAVDSTALSLSQSFANQPLVSSARGDVMYALQLHGGAVVDGSTVLAVTRALKLPSLDMSDGAATTISGTGSSFSQPPFATVSLSYRRSQFVALRDGTAPAASLGSTTSHQLYVCALLGGSQLKYGFYSNSADLMAYSSTGSSDVTLDQVRVGNPFPSSYGLYGYASATFPSSYTLPGATSSVKISNAVTYAAPLADFASGPVQPRLGPATDFQINGQSAQTTTAAVTTQPVLTWSPPQLGSANGYTVSVHQLYLRSSTQTAQRLLAQFHTTQTRVVVPPGLLQSGEYYVFRVVAQHRPGFDNSRPFRGTLPASTATVLSALVTP